MVTSGLIDLQGAEGSAHRSHAPSPYGTTFLCIFQRPILSDKFSDGKFPPEYEFHPLSPCGGLPESDDREAFRDFLHEETGDGEEKPLIDPLETHGGLWQTKHAGGAGRETGR